MKQRVRRMGSEGDRKIREFKGGMHEPLVCAKQSKVMEKVKCKETRRTNDSSHLRLLSLINS